MLRCDDVRPRLTELALGDLDAEPAREVREHLAGCAACRVDESAAARTLGLLASTVPPSTGRRLAAVEAMREAHEGSPVRRRWMFGAAAAAVLAGATSLVWIASSPGPTLRTAEVVGRAEIFRAAEGRWSPASVGDPLRPGDRLVVAGGGSVRLDGPGVSVRVGSGTSMGLAAGGLTLERGQLRIESTGAQALSVLDTVNDTITIRRGRATVGLREVRGMVAGSFETRGAGTSTPQAREVVSERLTVTVADGEADLDGSHRQRLRVTSGQEGGFEFDGRPYTRGEGR